MQGDLEDSYKDTKLNGVANTSKVLLALRLFAKLLHCTC